MGNPHTVIFCDKDDYIDELCITYGPLIETLDVFPQKTNVEFVQISHGGGRHLQLRVWERGCGYTQACGTGACAAVVAAALLHKFDEFSSTTSSAVALLGNSDASDSIGRYGEACRVSLPGGDLYIRWLGISSTGVIETVLMAGPAELIFKGEVLI